jgi:putative membrane protein
MRTAPRLAAIAALALVPFAGPAAAQAPGHLDDPTIVAIFDAANTADIETGKLAATKASSKEVRDFGAMIARDHEMVRQLGRDLAAKLHVTPTPPADASSQKAHEAAMKQLRGASGADFDLAFARHEAKFHADVIAAINSTLLPAIQNAELRALVVKVAPAFEGHRLAAEQLAKKLAAAH